MSDDALKIKHRDGIDAGKRFIEKNEGRFGGQSPGDFEPSTFTTGQGFRALALERCEAEVPQQLLDSPCAVCESTPSASRISQMLSSTDRCLKALGSWAR